MAAHPQPSHLGLAVAAAGVVPLAEACEWRGRAGAEGERSTPSTSTRPPPPLSLPPAADAALAALGYSAASLLRREAALAVCTAAAALGGGVGGDADAHPAGPARLLQAWAPPPPPPPSRRTALGPPGGPPPPNATALLLTRLLAAAGRAPAPLPPALASTATALLSSTSSPLPPRAWADLFSIHPPALVAACAAATRAVAGRGLRERVGGAVAGGRADGASLAPALALSPSLLPRALSLLDAWLTASAGHPVAWEVRAWLPAAVGGLRRGAVKGGGEGAAPGLALGPPPPPAAPGAPWFRAGDGPHALSPSTLRALERALARTPPAAARAALLARPDTLHSALVSLLRAPSDGGGGAAASRSAAATVVATALAHAPADVPALAAALAAAGGAWEGECGRSLPSWTAWLCSPASPLSGPHLWWLARVALPLAGLEAAGERGATAAAVLARAGAAAAPGSEAGADAPDPRLPARRLVVAWCAARGEGGLLEGVVGAWARGG